MDSKMQQAKEWAGTIQGEFNAGWPTEDHVNAAAEVIQSLPGQWVDAEKVREIYDRYRANETTLHEAFRAAVALTDPPLPTLAELIEQDSDPKKYQWMQADRRDERCVITRVYVTTVKPTARLLTPNGITLWVDADDVTPLPDLPRLKWPGSEQGASEDQRIDAWDEIVEHPFFTECFDSEKPLIEAMIDKLNSYVGEGTVQGATPEPSLPRPEDVPEGEAWIVLCGGKKWVGIRAKFHDFVPWSTIPWSIIRMDGLDYQNVSDSDITLISRLVPERKENA